MKHRKAVEELERVTLVGSIKDVKHLLRAGATLSTDLHEGAFALEHRDSDPDISGWRAKDRAMNFAWRDWILDYLEYWRHEEIYFATLTYRNNPDGSAPGIQRVRRSVNKWIRLIAPLRYSVVAVMEGGVDKRRHVHAVIVPNDHYDLGQGVVQLAASWKQGMIDVSLARDSASVIGYVTKYMTKQVDGESGVEDFWMEKG